MTGVREAITLPVLFLTVMLLAAIRPGSDVTLVPPSLASLVFGMILFALLVRSGALAPERLMNASRSGLANVNGLFVLLTTFAASAQVITLVVPDGGVPALVAWVVLASLLLQALAISPDRQRLLRGLVVTFGAAFTLKFIVLATISAPAERGVARALQLLFEGVTLGTVSQRTPHPLEGYLAFATLALYLVALALLPAATWHMARVTDRVLPDHTAIEVR
ncbi:MAG: hypothetical protein M3478_11975 [Planctomycetota bacterium]|nr:hypothetical protein [Planctomycetota bacterium]